MKPLTRSNSSCALHSSARGETPFEGNAEAIGVACYTSGVGPLLGFWLEQGGIAASPQVSAVLERHLRHNRLRMDRLVY